MVFDIKGSEGLRILPPPTTDQQPTHYLGATRFGVGGPGVAKAHLSPRPPGARFGVEHLYVACSKSPRPPAAAHHLGTRLGVSGQGGWTD